MRSKATHPIWGAVIILLATAVAAMGFEPMTATVQVASGSLYDYVVIGEHTKATDGFDNAYDIISPGNLNADMGEPFISAVVRHPEWHPAREMRGDTRAPAKRAEWEVSVTSSLAKGSPLAVRLVADQSVLPQGTAITVRDGNKSTDLKNRAYTLSAPGPGSVARLVLVVEQP